METMSRSSLEAYGGIILAAVIAWLTWAGIVESTPLVIAASVLIFLLLADVLWRSPVTVHWPRQFKLACVAGLIISLGYSDQSLFQRHLEKEQEDVYQGMSGAAYLPPSKDPYLSLFTIRNGSTNQSASTTLRA